MPETGISHPQQKSIHSVIFFYNGDHAFGAETVIGFVRDGNLIFKYRLL